MKDNEMLDPVREIEDFTCEIALRADGIEVGPHEDWREVVADAFKWDIYEALRMWADDDIKWSAWRARTPLPTAVSAKALRSTVSKAEA